MRKEHYSIRNKGFHPENNKPSTVNFCGHDLSMCLMYFHPDARLKTHESVNIVYCRVLEQLLYMKNTLLMRDVMDRLADISLYSY